MIKKSNKEKNKSKIRIQRGILRSGRKGGFSIQRGSCLSTQAVDPFDSPFFYFLSIEFGSWCEQPSIATFSASFDWPMKQYRPTEQHEGRSFVHTLFVFHLSLSRLVGQEKQTNQKIQKRRK